MGRIIAGRWRGHRLAAPGGSRTRPTTDRVREAVFAAVVAWAGTSGEAPEQQLRGFSFLDLYAGSGAVGLEAASRGARPVVLVESEPAVSRTAVANVTALGATGAHVTTAKVETFVATPAPQPYDIVWLDPPYSLPSASISAVLTALAGQGWVATDGLVLVERSVRDPAPVFPASLGAVRQRRYGETTVFVAEGEDA